MIEGSTREPGRLDRIAVRVGLGLIGGVALALLSRYSLALLFYLGPDLGPQAPFLDVATAGMGALGMAMVLVAPDTVAAGRRLLPSTGVAGLPLLLISLA
jgi:hypothetical protein